jgi:hypothetical protein
MTQWEAQYRLTAASMARAAAWGYMPAQIIALLGQFSGGEIPPAALSHLRTWQRTTTTCTAQSGYYLGMPPGTLKALHPRKAFRQRVRLVGGTQRLDRFTPQGAWVAQAQAPALFRYLRHRGYQVNVPDTPTMTPSPIPCVLPTALRGLLVACHTYQILRQRWPALAQAEVGTLIRDLERALPEPDRAAVARLVAAQRALIARALDQDQDAIPPPLRTRLETAIATGTPLTLTYIDTHAQRTQRVIHPLRLEERWGQTYLVADCELRGEERHFRLDRIIRVT